MTSRLRNLTNDQLVSVYLEEALLNSNALRLADTRLANPAALEIANVYRELRRRGEAAQRGLLALLDHPDPGVRCWAGAHALEFAPIEGERTLSEVAESDYGEFSMTAGITLETWKAGELTFP
jgi:hypothetical protein